MYQKKLAKVANDLGFVWTDDEGFADFKFLLWGGSDPPPLVGQKFG